MLTDWFMIVSRSHIPCFSLQCIWDCSFIGKKLHFVEYDVEDPNIVSAQEKNIAGYLAAKRYAEQHGIKIYNATRGGELEVFERVKLEQIVK